MIVKFFTHGSGSASGVFNYLLGEENDREDAELLRGDVATQSLLIDSLDFTHKYTSGCLSFEEKSDQVTAQQKNNLMDGFEKTITAGLDRDRVSFTWIEHRDKDRLELNFVIANVDLKHGRLFQPYVHSHDLWRVNAWKNIQNIEHGFTDPNDPAKKRLMGQRDNLPRNIKEVREIITNSLKDMAVDGFITNRADVIKALEDADLKITRQTKPSISIENPDPDAKHPIRLTGALYERDFEFSAELQSEISRESEEYRGSDQQRLIENVAVYDRATRYKQSYHEQRHSEPKREQQVDRGLRGTDQRLDRYLTLDPTSPYTKGAKRPQGRDSADDEQSFERYESSRERERIALDGIDKYKAMGSLSVKPSIVFSRVWQWHNVGLADAKAINGSDKRVDAGEPRHDSPLSRNDRRQKSADRGIKHLTTIISEYANGSLAAITAASADINESIERAIKQLSESDQQARPSDCVTRAHDRDREQTSEYRESFDSISSATQSIKSIVIERQDRAQYNDKPDPIKASACEVEQQAAPETSYDRTRYYPPSPRF